MGRFTLLVCFALGASTVAAATPAGATSTPSLHLKLAAHARAGHASEASYSASSLGSDSLVIQRFNGTSWQTVQHLHSTSGKATLPALSIGVYDIRLAAFTNHGELATAVGRKLHVFGRVSFADLFAQPAHTYSLPQANFRYVFQFYNSRGAYTALVAKNAPCDSIHIQFVPGSDNGQETLVGVSSATLYLGRHDRSKLHKTVAPQTIGKVGGPLDLNGAWSIYLAQAASGGQLITWYVNGFADCDATSIKTWATPGSA
jgi:hypothetical protein